MSGQSVLRPYTFVVGLYSFNGGGTLVCAHRLPVVLKAANPGVVEAMELPASDPVIVDDEGLTYAVVRSDGTSLSCLTASLGSLRDPVARSLAWSMLHNLVHSAVIDVALFIQVVLARADDDTKPNTLTVLLNQALQITRRYTSQRTRCVLLRRLVADDLTGPSSEGEPAALPGGWGRLRAATPRFDAQIVRARTWLEAVGQARLFGGAGSAQVAIHAREVLDGVLPGLGLDAGARRRTLAVLARSGAINADELKAQQRADPTVSDITHHLQASNSVSYQDLRTEVFERLLGDTSVSDDHIGALVTGFAIDAHYRLIVSFTPRCLREIQGLWAERGQEIATQLIIGLLPSYGDEVDVQTVEGWLAAHPRAPSTPRRLILRSLDGL